MTDSYRLSWPQFESVDRLVLPGLLFEPQNTTKVAVISLHGNGSSATFYNSGLHTVLGEAFCSKGVAYFPFNNRGAGYVQNLHRRTDGEDERQLYGAAYELIGEAPLDIDGAVAMLRERGYEQVFVLGFSTGANKICVYDNRNPHNDVSGYIMACPGDDCGIYYDILGGESFQRILEESGRMVSDDRGRELASYPELEGQIISYQSLHELLDPNGEYNTFPYNESANGLNLSQKPLFAEYSAITKPSLVVLGSHDEYCLPSAGQALEALKSHNSNKNKEFSLLEGADHGFSGKEAELGALCAEWVKKTASR